MSEGDDFTFMRSGFNNLVEPDETFENTAAVIMVLLIFLILMNSLAIYLRKKFEKDIN